MSSLFQTKYSMKNFLWPLMATILYVIVAVSFMICYWPNFIDMDPGQWGDFIGGVLSPPAIFWVAAALWLQAMEFVHQKEEAKKASDQLRAEAESRRIKIMPGIVASEIAGYPTGDPYPFKEVKIQNSSYEARYLTADVKGPVEAELYGEYFQFFQRGEHILRVVFHIDFSGMFILSLRYEDVEGNAYRQHLTFRINAETEDRIEVPKPVFLREERR